MKRTPAQRTKTFSAPEDAYFEFFRADSAKDGQAWAAVMSYPHVRVAANGRTAYYDTPEDYAARASWARREATGWVRSVGVDPARLHESADKVHLLGGWTRYNAQDQPILRNRVTYILTLLDGSWGIQARFGTDSFTEGEQYDATPAVDLVAEHLQAVAGRDLSAAAALCRFPFTEVGVGRVDTYQDADEFVAGFQPVATPEAIGGVTAAQAGREGVVVAATWDEGGGDIVRAVFVVGRVEGRWQIAGRSAIPTG